MRTKAAPLFMMLLSLQIWFGLRTGLLPAPAPGPAAKPPGVRRGFSVSSTPGNTVAGPGAGGAGGSPGGFWRRQPPAPPGPASGAAGGFTGGFQVSTGGAGGFQLVKNTTFVVKVIKLSSRVCWAWTRNHWGLPGVCRGSPGFAGGLPGVRRGFAGGIWIYLKFHRARRRRRRGFLKSSTAGSFGPLFYPASPVRARWQPRW